MVHSSGATKTTLLDNNSIVPSRLGFKGTEDLGGGASAFFGIESGFSPVSGQTGPVTWNRGSFIGLGSRTLGKVSFGRQWNLNDDFLCGLYVCGGYAAFYNFPGFGSSSDLVNGAIKYTLPSIAGLNGNVIRLKNKGAGTVSLAGGTVNPGGAQNVFTLGLAHAF